MVKLQQIVGQTQARSALERALESEQISHAYLLTGPAGVGKRTAALAFGREIVLTDDPEGEVLCQESIHPDLMIVQKLENKTQIGIEQINRGIEPWLGLKPYRARHRVVIIEEANLLSLPAANALLKTLEDPPAYAVLILTSDEPNLLETIVSRCQLIRFSPLLEQDVFNLLVQRGIEAERAQRLAKLGQGSISAALYMGEAESLDGIMAVVQKLILKLYHGKELEVIDCAEQMEKDPFLYSGLLSCLLRDISIFQSTNRPELLVTGSQPEFFQGFPLLEVSTVSKALQNIDQLRRQYRGPVNSLLLSISISYHLKDALK